MSGGQTPLVAVECLIEDGDEGGGWSRSGDGSSWIRPGWGRWMEDRYGKRETERKKYSRSFYMPELTWRHTGLSWSDPRQYSIMKAQLEISSSMMITTMKQSAGRDGLPLSQREAACQLGCQEERNQTTGTGKQSGAASGDEAASLCRRDVKLSAAWQSRCCESLLLQRTDGYRRVTS